MTHSPTAPFRAPRRAALLAALALACAPALADSWPSRPVRIVVPFAAGGVSDAAARMVANDLGKALGQSVFIAINVTGSHAAFGTKDTATSTSSSACSLATATAAASGTQG